MAEKVPGTDNVFVFGVREEKIVSALTEEQIDQVLIESHDLQIEQINNFIQDLKRHKDRTVIVNYGSLTKHLQQECVLHLSALSAAAILRLAALSAILEDKNERIEFLTEELDFLTEELDLAKSELEYRSNR